MLDTATFRHTRLSEPPSIAEIEREIAWENDAVNRAVKRYREEVVEGRGGSRRAKPDSTAKLTAAADTTPGMTLIRDVMSVFVPFVADMQETIRDQLTGSVGQPRDWWTYVCLVDPEKLAYLTIRAVLGERPCAALPAGRKLSQCSRALVTSVQTEVAYQDWVAEDRKAAKEAKELGVAYQRQLDALKRRVKSVNSRTWSRWMSRLERAWKQPWPETDRRQFGDAMIKRLAEHGGGLIELVNVPQKGGKTELYVRVSDRALTLLEDSIARGEVARPLDRPMLCRPKPWKWSETGCPLNSVTTNPSTPQAQPVSTTEDITSTAEGSFVPA